MISSQVIAMDLDGKNDIPRFICFVGIHGSGKSIYVKRTQEELEKIRI